ncbi:hypothetical protein M758_1G041800 [Ceratodon purpureus]|nr:hypothetical protein M758_1G041800 [Ceratodon purpureus]
MAQAMRVMQVVAICGSKAAILQGFSQNLDVHVAFGRSKKFYHSSGIPSSLRASSQLKDQQKTETASVVAPATIASTLLVNANAANALTGEDVTGAFYKVQSVTSQVTQSAGNAIGVVRDALQQLYTIVKPGVDVATPYVQQTADTAYRAALPVATDLEQQVEKALQGAGVDPKPVVDAAKSVVSVAGEAAGQAEKYIEAAQPYALSTFENIIASDPLVLATGAGALLLVYFLAPPLLSSVSYAARGYKGDLTAPQALDLLVKENYTLVDVRSDREKSKSGVPSLPRNAKNKILPVPIEELPGKVKGQLRDVRKVEAEIAALKISALKRLNKGSKIVIIDSTGNIAKIIARSLSELGFKNTWVVLDGYDGGKGWLQSKLGSESYKSSFGEILSPSRVIPAGTKKFFSNASKDDVVDVGTRFKFLPEPSDD